jgi:hypothetical protein
MKITVIALLTSFSMFDKANTIMNVLFPSKVFVGVCHSQLGEAFGLEPSCGMSEKISEMKKTLSIMI